MRAVVQRVKQGSVSVGGDIVGSIKQGLVVFLGVGKGDTDDDALFLAEKIANLRIFADAEDKMNLSVRDIQGAVLAISQFTLFGDCRKGRRPGFSQAAPPEEANELYEKFISFLSQMGLSVQTGIFQADMLVSIENDGPVTMLLDSKKLF
ncbi:D-aminoacyl-tRNA deacylase [Candidatus Formimonas warabiya]|uniref:D-aminoacyl-tRNA deacylase n=1 Tax=Formimonas warabiya TaxID=1761012 RepID=A0A3G1KNC6_FORW1|nr:D-aminoacyl-tRNA deacylase [Candidatus Formimonas warabiya]ATW23964.1 D-tyrosyl-tRNA(Tyr) deacylase [Candidatus Formimonas warabiya]